MIRFKPWEEEAEDLELHWLGGFRNDVTLGWHVRVISRRLRSKTLRDDWVPIGLLPLLTPGHVVSGGEVLSTVVTGVPLEFDIPDLSKGIEEDAANVPPPLYYFDRHWGWKQRVLRYHVGDEVCLIPTIELVRHLFLLNKRLAWAIMDPFGLGNLAVPTMPGIYTGLHIDFTESMPLKCLGKLEAQEFAWLAIHPDGRRCWDSVRCRSLHRPYVSLEPPPINTHIDFRGVKLGKHTLVLEIEKLFGRSLPCDRLTYSHPADRHIVHDGTADDAGRPHKRTTKTDVSAIGEGTPDIDPRLGSRRNQHQKALPLVERFSTFDRDIPEKCPNPLPPGIHLPRVPTMAPPNAEQGQWYPSDFRSASIRRYRKGGCLRLTSSIWNARTIMPAKPPGWPPSCAGSPSCGHTSRFPCPIFF